MIEANESCRMLLYKDALELKKQIAEYNKTLDKKDYPDFSTEQLSILLDLSLIVLDGTKDKVIEDWLAYRQVRPIYGN
jgi:hypothetical protein